MTSAFFISGYRGSRITVLASFSVTGSLKWDNFITFHANDKPISKEQENYSCVVEDFYLDIISVPYDATNVLKIIFYQSV